MNALNRGIEWTVDRDIAEGTLAAAKRAERITTRIGKCSIAVCRSQRLCNDPVYLLVYLQYGSTHAMEEWFQGTTIGYSREVVEVLGGGRIDDASYAWVVDSIARLRRDLGHDLPLDVKLLAAALTRGCARPPDPTLQGGSYGPPARHLPPKTPEEGTHARVDPDRVPVRRAPPAVAPRAASAAARPEHAPLTAATHRARPPRTV